MPDFVTRTLRFIGPDGMYSGFKHGQAYEVHYQRESYGVRLLLGQDDPQAVTLLVTEAEFEKWWVK